MTLAGFGLAVAPPPARLARVIAADDLTVSDRALPAETDAVCRAVLATIWSDLDEFTIDLSDLGDTPDTAAAVAALAPYRGRTLFRRRPTQEADIELGKHDEADATALDAVLALATLTHASHGVSIKLGGIAYNVDDKGTSCYFLLTAAHRARVDDRLRSMGISTDLLVPEP